MSESAKPGGPTTPLFLDYLLVLAGVCLSLVLVHFTPLAVEPRSTVPEGARDLVALLPAALRLSEGVILFWPLFLGLQHLRGRSNPLTTGEWLLVFSWLGVATFFGLGLAARQGLLIEPYFGQARRFWYVVVVPSMGGLALLFALFGLFRRSPAPWTHPFSLALVFWPVLPLAAILTLARFA
jgi:hypothetical protein